MQISSTIILVLTIAVVYLIKKQETNKRNNYRFLVHLTIEINIEEVKLFIRNKLNIRDKKLLNMTYGKEMPIKKSYTIDIIQHGKNSLFFNREKNAFSGNIKELSHLEQEEKTSANVYTQNIGIKTIKWDRWNNCIYISVITKENEEIIIMQFPIQKLNQLIAYGKLSDLKSFDRKRTKIKVPISYDQKNNAKENIEIFEETGGFGNWIRYENLLASISIESPNIE